MAKAVLISICPEWVNRIISGEKTVEIRKNRPNLKTPYKCYIYMTKQRKPFTIRTSGRRYDGRIVAEFICDSVKCIMEEQFVVKEDAEKALEGSLMTINQAKNYAIWKNGAPHYECKDLYAWHISNLKIYDDPKHLSEFKGLRKTKFGYAPVEIERPPQSWRYVEEKEASDG